MPTSSISLTKALVANTSALANKSMDRNHELAKSNPMKNRIFPRLSSSAFFFVFYNTKVLLQKY